VHITGLIQRVKNMKIPTLPPWIKYSIIWVSLALTFAVGTYFGAKSSIAQGVVNEVDVLVGDALVVLEIREKVERRTKQVEEHLNEINPTDCGKRSMRDILGLWDDSEDTE
jgi:hypothetical protein